MLDLFWLLLPVAAASGWYLAKRDSHRKHTAFISGLSPDYFKGLNYLLNEQTDKAIEVFVKMLEVDSETVEIHLALGNLFRMRGEVDRAIRIHQNLIDRPTLNKMQRNQAMFELALDHMRAGLLDRAEALFLELIDKDPNDKRALRLLSEVYQQEREWDKAIETVRKLERASGEKLDHVVAQFYCELAEQARERKDIAQADKLVKQALATDPRCVRASLLQGDILALAGDARGAIRAFRQVEEQDPAYLSEIVKPLMACCGQSGETRDLAEYLEGVAARRGGVTPLLAVAEMIEREQGVDAAIQYLMQKLRDRLSLRGLAYLLKLEPRSSASGKQETLDIVKATIARVLEEKPVYQCSRCGFTGKSLHWHCPGCKSWNTVKPIQGVEGE